VSLAESAVRYNIARTLGDARVLTFTRRQSQGGAVVDCTGMAASLILHDPTGTAVATLSTGNGGIAPLTSAGQIGIDLSQAAYAALGAGIYSYRLDLVEGGRQRPYLRGNWRIFA
jgi:hypothetical protein